MTNLLPRIPMAAQPAVATLVRSIFAQPDAGSVRQQHRTVGDQLSESLHEAAEMLDEAEPHLMAFATFPKAVWKQIWSNKPLERRNEEVRRRTDVADIFPNRRALLRLAGALLAEQNDEWVIRRRYRSLEVIAQVLARPEPQIETPDQETLAIPA